MESNSHPTLSYDKECMQQDNDEVNAVDIRTNDDDIEKENLNSKSIKSIYFCYLIVKTE